MFDKNKSGTRVSVFLDDSLTPFTEFETPCRIVLDTTKIPDGKHKLKLVALSTSNKEGVKFIDFEVRNGPDVSVVGLDQNQIVNNKIPIVVNAYGSENEKVFLVHGSENPKGIPIWIWIFIILFIGWGIHYLFLYWTSSSYNSFF